MGSLYRIFSIFTFVLITIHYENDFIVLLYEGSDDDARNLLYGHAHDRSHHDYRFSGCEHDDGDGDGDRGHDDGRDHDRVRGHGGDDDLCFIKDSILFYLWNSLIRIELETQ